MRAHAWRVSRSPSSSFWRRETRRTMAWERRHTLIAPSLPLSALGLRTMQPCHHSLYSPSLLCSRNTHSLPVSPSLSPLTALVPPSIAAKLVTHIEELVQSSIERRYALLLQTQGEHTDTHTYTHTGNNTSPSAEQSLALSRQLIALALQQCAPIEPSNRAFFALGESLSRAVAELSVEQLSLSLSLCLRSPQSTDTHVRTHIHIPTLLQLSQQRLAHNQEVFNTISQHHRQIVDIEQWNAHTQREDLSQSLRSYSVAATSMGRKLWVKESNDWMAEFLVSFFRYGGAKKHYCKAKNIGKYDNATLFDALAKDLMVSAPSTSANTQGREESTPQARRIRVLDVGSCYNPLHASPQSEALEVTAIDLCPATDSVLQCDFLSLAIGERDSAPIFRYDETGRAVGVQQLPRESFDAITMSLVLSYLPTPAERETMIRKAQQLLRTPPDSPSLHSSSTQSNSEAPHNAGLLLIVEKQSIFKDRLEDKAQRHLQDNSLLGEWKKSISSEGFDLVRYTLLRAKDGRCSHAFAFAKSSSAEQREMEENTPKFGGESGAGSHPKAKFRLWIKQDFARENNSELVGKEGDENKPKESKQEEKTNDSSSSSNCTPSPLFSYNERYFPVGIIGGGMGGSALALALQKKKIPFVLFEKDTHFESRRQGYALTMQQGGIALRELDLVEDILREGAVSVIHYSYNAQGRLIGAYGAGKREGMREFDSSIIRTPQELKHRTNVHIPRQKLRELIIRKIDPQHIQWNKKLVSFDALSSSSASFTADRDPEALLLRFSDESEYAVSTVIGADGVFSNVRQQMMRSYPPHYCALSYLNLLVILGIARTKSSIDGQHLCVRQWVDGENRVFSMPFDRENTMWQMSFPLSEQQALSLSSLSKHGSAGAMETGARLKEVALARCAGWDPALLSLLDSTTEFDISGHPVYDRDPHLGVLSRGELQQSALYRRVTLLGDAAHPMSPFKGQGANQALLDALHLSRALLGSDLAKSGRCDVSEALRDFEEDMLFRVSPKVLKSREAAVYLHSPSALAEGNITRAKAAQLFGK